MTASRTSSHEVHPTEPSIEKSVLGNGIRVLTERMPEAKSATLGFWVSVGSRDEAGEHAGVSHFLEHLLFKGTPARTARSIAMSIDAVGGEMNAYTAREHTTYYTRLPVAHIELGLTLLCEVLTDPAFRDHEVDAEREVIIEEILMNEDIPDDLAHTALYATLFPGHPLGRETLGEEHTVNAMTRDDIRGFFGDLYQPANLVVAAAGDLEHDQVLAAVHRWFGERDPGHRPERRPPDPGVGELTVIQRPTEQAHVCYGWRALDHNDPDRYALWVANHILGGGVSSRLFQEVREERGLAYTVGSSPGGYSDSGSLVCYAGTVPSRLEELIDLLDSIIFGLAADGITPEEHAVALGYLEGSLLLGLEDSASRMVRLGSNEIVRGEVIPIDEHVERIRAVSIEDANRVLREVLSRPRAVAAVGPFGDDLPAFDRFR